MITKFIVRGMDCKACKVLIEDVCRDVPGVKKCTLNLKTGEAVVQHTAEEDILNIKKEVEALGKYKVIL